MKRKALERWTGLLMAAALCAALLMGPWLPGALADEYNELYPENLAEGHLTATAAILIDQDSGRVIFEKNPDERMYPASTTKILTVWLALRMAESLPVENAEGMTAEDVRLAQLHTKYAVSANAANLAPDESSAKFAIGEEIRLIDLCNAAILVSGNDAATAIAEGLSGSVEAFAERMNQAAYALGCTGTHFVNANGLHDENHYTTARDMALLARVAMQDDEFSAIVRRPEYILPADNIYRSRSLANGNNFVARSSDERKAGRYYEGATGIKTGTTSAAGNCLVASASKDGVRLIAVVLGAVSDSARYEDAKKLMNYGFSQFISTSIAEIYLMNPRVIDIRGFALDDPQVGRLQLDIHLKSTDVSDQIVTDREELEYWKQNFSSLTVTEFSRELTAPIVAGEVMGTLTYYGGTMPVVYELTAARSIQAREDLAPSVDQIIEDALNDPNPFPRLTAELVVLYIVLPALGLVIAFRLLRSLFKLLRRRKKVKAYKPTSRYYR